MDEKLFVRAKLEATRQGRPMSALFEEALERYLEPKRSQSPRYLSVAETWGAMAVSPEIVREVMEDEDDWLDA